MQLKYGTFPFEANTNVISSSTRVTFSRAKTPLTYETSLTVKGDLLADVGASDLQANLSAKELAMRAALRMPFKDLIFYTDAGAMSSIILPNAGSLSGVTISNIEFPGQAAQGEFVARRQYSFTASAEYLFSPLVTPFVYFTETLEFHGGGPRHIMCEAVTNVPPQRQLTYPQTKYCVTQSGEAEGLLAFPNAPPPKFPFALIDANPRLRMTTPDRIGFKYRNYKISWSYSFEWHVRLAGIPTLWT